MDMEKANYLFGIGWAGWHMQVEQITGMEYIAAEKRMWKDSSFKNQILREMYNNRYRKLGVPFSDLEEAANYILL